jgi:hypothetical protein
MKGYAIVDRNNEEGKASQGFQKILSAIQKYEAYEDWAEENACDALMGVKLIPTKWENIKWKLRGHKPKLVEVVRVRNGARWNSYMGCVLGTSLKEALVMSGYLTQGDAWGLNGDLEFVHQKKEYESLRNIIRNGEQFMLDEDLCKFVNFWNRKEVPR